MGANRPDSELRTNSVLNEAFKNTPAFGVSEENCARILIQKTEIAVRL